MVCAKAIATMIPIATPVLDVSREMDMRVFPGVREVVNQGGIIVIRRHRYLLLPNRRFLFPIKPIELLTYSLILASKSNTLCVRDPLVFRMIYLPIPTFRLQEGNHTIKAMELNVKYTSVIRKVAPMRMQVSICLVLSGIISAMFRNHPI